MENSNCKKHQQQHSYKDTTQFLTLSGQEITDVNKFSMFMYYVKNK